MKKDEYKFEKGKYKRTRSIKKAVSTMLVKLWKNPEYRKRMSLSHVGHKQSKETIEKRIPQISGKNNGMWKGDAIGKHAVHNWIKKVLGKPTMCEHCLADGLSRHQIHWANKSGKYLRRVSDWIRLCMSCHMRYDYKKGLRKYKKHER